MSKKLVASLMGWLVLSFFIMSSVWAAANKDKTPVKKESKAQTAWTAPKKIQVTKAQLRPGWTTLEQQLRDLERNKRAELEFHSVYEAVSGIIEDVPFFQPGVLGVEPAPENFDVAGRSYYDINANHRNPRQIAISRTNRNVGIGWAKCPDNDLVPRNWYASLWIGASKAGGNFIKELLVPPGPVGRGGFGGVTYLPRSGKLVIYSHHAEAPRGTFAAIEKTAGGFDWDFEYNIPDSLPGNATDLMGIWPTAAGGFIIDAADYDNDLNFAETLEVIHFISNEGNLGGGTIDDYIYARGVDSAGALIFPGFTGNVGISADSGTRISPTVVTSKVSRKVAIIYTSERAFDFEPVNKSDVYYIESTNGGEDWVTAGSFAAFPGTNITNLPITATTRPNGDVMGVYDDNDSLVISWSQWVDYDPVSGGSSRETDLYVWTAAFGKRKAQDGNFTNLAGGLVAGGQGYTLQWPHIAVNDGITTPARKGFLYMTYARYGDDTAAFADTSFDGFINGEVYITASTNGGKTWSAPINATNSQSPGCPAPVSGDGTCLGVSYASCAEFCDDTIYIAYMTDENPGDVIGDNPTLLRTNNEVYFMKYPAFTPPPTIQISATPANFIQDPDSAVNLTDTFFVQNIGNANLTVDSIVEGNPATWLTINNGTTGFTIIEAEPDVAIGFTVNDLGLADGAYHDTLLVYNNSANKPIAKIPVILVVDNVDEYLQPKWVELATGEVNDSSGHMNLLVSNIGNVAHQSDTGGMYRIVPQEGFAVDSTDTTFNLFEATKFFAVKSTLGDTLVGRWMFEQQNMLPLSDITVQDTTIASSGHHIAGTRVTLDSGTWRHTNKFYYAAAFPLKANLFGLQYPGPWFRFKICEQLWVKKVGKARYQVVWHWKVIQSAPPTWWVNTPAFATTEDIYLGIGADWDAYASQSGRTSVDNFGRTGPGTGVAWIEGSKRGPTYDSDSLLVQNGHYGYIAFLDRDSTSTLALPDPYGMHIVSNPSYLYPSGGYVDGELYQIAADNAVDTTILNDSAGTYKYFDPVNEANDTIPTDLNMVMTLAKLTNPYPETTDVVILLGTIAPVDSCAPPDSCIFTGMAAGIMDANSGCNGLAVAVNAARKNLLVGGADDTIPDLTAKLGCLTTSCVAKPGDANASGNYTLGDAIAIVNYIFSKPGCLPLPTCWLSGLLCRGDWNGSGNVTLGDVIRAVNFIFNKPGGPWNAIPIEPCCQT